MRKLLYLSAVLIFGFFSCSTRNVSMQQSLQVEESVVINGVRWATRNVDASGTFAENPESLGMLFQWNRRAGWTTQGSVSRWNTSVPTGIEWEIQNNPCPDGWRVPTFEEVTLLHSAIGEWTTRNGVFGRFFGTAPYQIFLPASGVRYFVDGALLNVGSSGFYWSSTQSNATHAFGLWFSDENIGAGFNSNNRMRGLSIRCVAID